MSKISVEGFITAILLARIAVKPYDTRKHEELAVSECFQDCVSEAKQSVIL